MNRINVRQARQHFSELLDSAAKGESVTIQRHGEDVARIVPAKPSRPRRLPDLSEFRAGLHVKGEPMSQQVIAARQEQRY